MGPSGHLFFLSRPRGVESGADQNHNGGMIHSGLKTPWTEGKNLWVTLSLLQPWPTPQEVA